MTGAVVISWRQGVPGRETKGLEVFGKALAHFEGLAKVGRIHAHKEYFAITGPASGFMICEGNLDDLFKILTEDETRQLVAEAQAIVEDFRVQIYGGGTDHAVQRQVTTFVEALQGLGYA